MTTTSSDLYKLLQSTFADAEALIKAGVGDENLRIGFSIYGGPAYDSKSGVEFRIMASSYPQPECKVEGTDFWELVAELIRREGFNRRQRTLAIGHQTLENTEA